MAVVAFANLTNDPGNDWLSAGIGETLTTKLAQVPSLTVVERMHLNYVLDELKLSETGLVEPKRAAEVGKLVQAGAVITGACQQDGGDIRVTARVVDVAKAEVVKSVLETGKTGEIFAVQDRLTDSLLAALGVTVPPQIVTAIHAAPASSLDCYKAYCEGILRLHQGRYDAAALALAESVTCDPEFTAAQRTLKLVKWARPSTNARLYMAMVDEPFDRVYDAMLRAVPRASKVKVKSESRADGKISAERGVSCWSYGMKVDVEVKQLEGFTGIRIYSREKHDLITVEGRKVIIQILNAFDDEIRKEGV